MFYFKIKKKDQVTIENVRIEKKWWPFISQAENKMVHMSKFSQKWYESLA
jgi:hypothetical protein